MKVWFGNYEDGFFKYNVLKKFMKGDEKYLVIEATIADYYDMHLVDVGNQEVYPSNKKTDLLFIEINAKIQNFNDFKKSSEEKTKNYWLEFCK